MSNPLETIPPTSENLQFPGGDITARSEMKAYTLLEKLSSGDNEQRTQNLKSLRQREIPFLVSTAVEDIKLLAELWGRTRLPFEGDKGGITFNLGFQYSVAFIKSCQLLPTNFHDFYEEMFNMTEYDADTQQFFTDQAWLGMQESHPRLYSVMTPLSQLAIETLELHDENSIELLRSGLVFPYIMASTSRMDGYMQGELKSDRIPRPEVHIPEATD